MALSSKQISGIKKTLQLLCCDDNTVSADVILSKLKEEVSIDIELYRFRTELSSLIKDGKISGYDVKVGRSGGFKKTETIERVSVRCSSGEYVGCIPKNKLSKFLLELKRG